MDVYFYPVYPEGLYVHLGEKDFRVVYPNGRMFKTVWLETMSWAELMQLGFELIGEIAPEMDL